MPFMPGSILGTPVTPVEDPDLITRRGRSVGDVQVDGLAPPAFVRSPVAHARLRGRAAGGREEDGEQVLRDAALVVRARMVNQRVAVAPMEGNAITVVPGDDGRGHDLTVYVSTQMPHVLGGRAAEVLGLQAERIRVVT